MNGDCVNEGILQAYLDSELGSRTPAVAAHLRHCERCSAELRRLQMTATRVDGLLDALADKAPDPAVFPSPHSRYSWRIAVVGLAACLAVAALLLILRSRSGFPVANAPNKVPFDSQRVANAFITEPEFDPALPTGKLMIVQVELPVSALSLDVIRSDVAASSSRVLAEVLMDEDGTTYGVRLANTQGE
jgi:anti-sigma factor RsiW